MLVKLKEGVEPRACAALGGLEARHAGTRFSRVFPHLLDPADIHRRNPARALRARGAARRPDLGRIYKITLGSPSADVLGAVRDLRQDPGVEYAEPNFIMRASVEVNDPFYSSAGSWGQPYDDLWGVKIIRADLAWSQADGLGVVVAVSDTGLDYNHEDIRNRVWVNPGEIAGNGVDDDGNGYVDDVRGWDFHNADNDPLEDQYHGTHVAGTIAAEGNNGVGIIGVAHRARIMPIKFLDHEGFGTLENGAASITYAAENGADVINMSWGGPSSQVVADAVADAHALGIVLVAAAGNSNADAEGFSPATHQEVMAVASTDHNDVKSDFSNWGTTIDVAAPGGDSADQFDPNPNYPTYLNIMSLYAFHDYLRLRGTSMASPHVAGVAALVLSRLPAASNVFVRELVEGTTDDIGSPGDDIYSGHGRVNAERAVQAAGLALDHPELRVTVTPLKPVAAPGGPAPVDVTVENIGLVQSPGFLMELFDGDPAEGGVQLRSWPIPWLEAGQSVTAHAYLTFPTLGVRTLVGFVDRANTIVEPIKANNRHVATVGVTTRSSFSESAVLTAPGVQQFPSISGDVVVWEDTRNHPTYPDIYAYDFSTGQETAIAFDTTVSHHRRHPTISGTKIVWQDNRDGRREIYLHDMATMTPGEEELLTPWPSLAFHNLSPVVSGHRVLYKGTNSWTDLDDPNVGGTLTLLDLTSHQETAIGPTNQYDIDGDRLVYDGVGGIHARDLTTGQDIVISVEGREPALSGSLAAFGIAASSYLSTVHVRDLVTMQETVIPAAPNESRRDIDIGGDLVVWSQAIYDIGTNQFSTFQIYAHDLTGGLTHQVSESEAGVFQPAVSGDRIIWLDGDDLDLHAATPVPFPTAVANLTGTRVTNKSARLDWSPNPEPDVVAYVVYYAFAPGGPYLRAAEVSALTYLHENLHPNDTYYYRVAARNQAGWEGTFSTEVLVDLKK